MKSGKQAIEWSNWSREKIRERERERKKLTTERGQKRKRTRQKSSNRKWQTKWRKWLNSKIVDSKEQSSGGRKRRSGRRRQNLYETERGLLFAGEIQQNARLIYEQTIFASANDAQSMTD